MKAAYIHKYGQTKVTLGSLEKPKIEKQNQVLVKVISASINPVDIKIQQGKLKPLLHFEFPLILGNDYVGIVEQLPYFRLHPPNIRKRYLSAVLKFCH